MRPPGSKGFPGGTAGFSEKLSLRKVVKRGLRYQLNYQKTGVDFWSIMNAACNSNLLPKVPRKLKDKLWIIIFNFV